MIAAGISGVALANGSEPQPDRTGNASPVSPEEKVLLYRAEERLIRHCMEDNGFEYYEIPPISDTPRGIPYANDDVVWAREHGYDVPQERARENPNTEPFDKLSSARQQAWQRMLVGQGDRVSVRLPDGPVFSISGQGCIASARRKLYGDLARWYRAHKLVEQIPSLVRQAVKDDARYDAAIADWAVCVRRRGHDVDNPIELREQLASRTRTMKPAVAHIAETRTAVAEASCARSASLSRVVQALEPEHERKVRTTFVGFIDELNAIEGSALPVARDIMASS